MADKEGKTAGELSKKAEKDTNKYKSMEVGEALANTVLDEVWKCVDAHKKIIDEPEFCVVMVLGSDALLKNVMRRKFYGYPFLPKPRPNQTVFLYRKKEDDIERLWTLPNSATMAELSSLHIVDHRYEYMKFWSDAFYKGDFFNTVRKVCKIDLESESEYLERNRNELSQAIDNNSSSDVPDTTDTCKFLYQ
jgi:hypothetical protein